MCGKRGETYQTESRIPLIPLTIRQNGENAGDPEKYILRSVENIFLQSDIAYLSFRGMNERIYIKKRNAIFGEAIHANVKNYIHLGDPPELLAPAT